jgi:phosphatidate cytidylyltransferase
VTLERVLTAAVMIPIVVVAVLWGPDWVVGALVALVALLAVSEFLRLAELAGHRGYARWTLLCALGLVFAQWQAIRVERHALPGGVLLLHDAPRITLEGVLAAFVIGIALAGALGRRAIREILPGAAASAAALLLVAFPFSYLLRLYGAPDGPRWVLFVLVVIWAGDTGAYLVGRSIGRLPMAPQLSPKKTWEGAAGNMAASLVAGAVFLRWLDAPLVSLLVGAALVNVAGQFGDLLESAYKRAAGVKDSGVLLPGHGGMLDRIDSLIFAAPVAWWYVAWLVRANFRSRGL